MPKKLEKMNEAQLQTVVKQIVTQIIENPLQAGDGEALRPSELIKKQRLRLKASLDVLKSIHPREGAALRAATFSALLSMLQAAPAGWMGGTIRKEIHRGLREAYTSEDAVALVGQASKIMAQLVNNDPIAQDYLQFLRKNLSLRQRKVFMGNLITEARSLTEENQIKAVLAVLIDQMPDAVSLLRDGDAAPPGYFPFLREKLPPKQLRVLTQALIEETAKLPEKTQDKIIAEIEMNWTAMNRLERDVILAGLKPKAGSSPTSKLAELYFDLQWQVESRNPPVNSALRSVGKRVALDEDIVHYLLEAPAKLDSEPVSGIQEKPTTRPPAPSHRPSASPGAVAIWGRKFEFNPKLVGPHDMTEISGMLASWSSHKKPPSIVGKALIGVRDRHPDAEIRRRAAEIIQTHGLDATDK
ncbi:MAG TPA: hypothetical protein VJR29_13770 [bacterium]|nr:hypothetical protein [bacterium]